MPKIFLSYRRGDSQDVTGRIYDTLVAHFSRDCVFKDVDSIPLGRDFRSVLARAIERADVVIAVIGPTWLTIADANGGRRLDDPDDFVHIELETALQLGKRIIPVMVSNTPMIAATDLPGPLQKLAFRNGLPVRPDPDFHTDMTRLIAALEGSITPRSAAPTRQENGGRRPSVLLMTLAVIGLLLPLLGSALFFLVFYARAPQLGKVWNPPDQKKELVAVELEIARLRHELENLDRDMKPQLSRIAEQTFEASRLRKEIAATKNAEVRQQRENLLEAKEAALKNARAQLDSLQARKLELQQKLAQLDGEMLDLKESKRPLEMDAGRLNEIKAALEKLDRDLEKSKREQELRDQFHK